MLTAYGGLLAVSVCFALVGMALSQASPSASRSSQDPQRLYEVTLPDVIIEVTWTVAIIIAVCTVPRPQYHAGGASQARLAAWLTAGPVLAASLIGNVWYHDLLRRYVDFPRMFEAESVAPPYAWELVFAVVSISIQPGIFEELFFRHVALGTLRSVMGSGAAIAVSAAMFGVAHLHSPISIPYLIIVGLVLGLFRVWSGSLLLPILMHATHNGVVLWMELQSLITR